MPAAEAFDSPAHGFEVAWDGVRALAFVDGSGVNLWGRALSDLTPQYPEVAALSGLVPPETIVDGELIVADSDGRPDFAALQEREHARSAETVERAAVDHPVTYVIYDLVLVNGRSLLKEPLHRRRSRLRDAIASTNRFYLPEPVVGEGLAFFDAAREKGLGGIVAKRFDSLYHPGQRHPDWLLIQAVKREDFAVLGFVPGRGRSQLEALVVGSYDGSTFRPVGKVVGGYDAAAAQRLRQQLDSLPVGPRSDDERWAGDETLWVQPRVVVGVKFSERDSNGQLRFPIFCGLRPEVAPEECVPTPMVDPAQPEPRRRAEIQLPRLPF
jgi:bifunctional non-homologous end joining protein LigD